MEIVTRKGEGLFPSPRDITLSCSCPDWATMCKHVAATLYGVDIDTDETSSKGVSTPAKPAKKTRRTAQTRKKSTSSGKKKTQAKPAAKKPEAKKSTNKSASRKPAAKKAFS